MVTRKARGCLCGQSTCFCNRCTTFRPPHSSEDRQRAGGGFPEEERVSEQEALSRPAAWTLSSAPQGHSRDASALGFPTLVFLPAPASSQAFSRRARGKISARGSQQLGGWGVPPPPTRDDPVSLEERVSCIQSRESRAGAKRPPISTQSKHPPRPLGQ